MPLRSNSKESEKNDLFSLKLSKRPLTINRRPMKLNKTLDSNVQKKDENYNYNKTYENNDIDIYNNIQNNNNDDNEKENIIIDQVLGDELNEIKQLWDNLGITPEYQIYFGEMLDRQNKREIIEKYLIFEFLNNIY